jgi:hypothetical protein
MAFTKEVLKGDFIEVLAAIFSIFFLCVGIFLAKDVMLLHTGMDCYGILEVYKPRSIVGKVVSKHRNKENHSIKTVFVLSNDGIQGCFTHADSKPKDSLSMYEFLQVGDSVVKHSGSLEVRVIRTTQNRMFDTIITLSCKNPKML